MIFVNGELLPAYAEAGLLRRSSKVIALVGSGGKTSTMFRLAREFAALGESVAVTTTTQLYKPETGFVFMRSQIPDPPVPGTVTIVGEPVQPEKIGPPDFLNELAGVFDRVLMEADGSNRLPLKYPAAFEPVLPDFIDTVLVVAGLSGLGRPLADVCHRKDLAAAILKKGERETLTPADICKLLSQGYGPVLSRFPGGIVLNQADTRAQQEAAKAIAQCFPELPVLAQSLPPQDRV